MSVTAAILCGNDLLPSSLGTAFAGDDQVSEELLGRLAKTRKNKSKHALMMRSTTPHRLLIFVPAHNESQAIRNCLEGVADQMVDFTHDIAITTMVIANNCTDNTVELAEEVGAELGLDIVVLDMQGNKQRKVGALNLAYSMIYGSKLDEELNPVEVSEETLAYRKSVKAILGMDADSRMAPGALKALWDELFSASDIGGVMSRYAMRMPISTRLLDPNDKQYDQKIASGEYGGPIARWLTVMQGQDMAAWTFSLFARGGSTYVLGGQATLFRPQALAEVVENTNRVGPWSNATDVEDMELTWQIQNGKYRRTLVSTKARTFVDSMKTYHAFVQQRIKWDGGLLGLLFDKDITKTRHMGYLWRLQLKQAMDLLVRVMFVTLFLTAIVTGQFQWNWLWAIPPIIGAILNAKLMTKTPRHRPIDVFMAATLISSEIYLLIRLWVWIRVWVKQLSGSDSDGWSAQYRAEAGETQNKLQFGFFTWGMLAAAGIWACVNFRPFLTSAATQGATVFYLQLGFALLSALTVFQTFAMLHNIWQLRKPYQP